MKIIQEKKRKETFSQISKQRLEVEKTTNKLSGIMKQPVPAEIEDDLNSDTTAYQL